MGNQIFAEKSKPTVAKVYRKVSEINKRSLGKLIVKTVGNDGTENNEEESYLRSQIQTCISSLGDYKSNTWQNATVTFLGLKGDQYVIESGKGRNRFMVYLNDKDEAVMGKLK